MHLLVPYLLNDFQTIRLTIHFSKPSFASRLSAVIGPINLIFISSCL